MKRSLSVLLAALLALGAFASAYAETSEADTLAAITQKVKETLNIGDDYYDFGGDYSDYGAKRVWNLHWYGDTNTIYVNCDSNGMIYEYSYDDYTENYSYSSDYAPIIPSVSADSCLPFAEAFLAGVITAQGEGWTALEASREETYAYDATAYGFSGYLTVNGYLTDISVSVNVRLSDMAIMYFYRSDSYSAYTGWKTPDALSDATAARNALEGAFSMELRYILDGPESANAILRYVPVQDGVQYIDAGTGEPVDVDERYNTLNAESDMTADASGMYADEATDRAALTKTELDGVERLEGALTGEQLDAIVRSYTEFGVDENYALTSLSVSTYDDGTHAYLTYMSELSRETLEQRYTFDPAYLDSLSASEKTYCVSKYATLNAKTGELESFYTYYPYNSGPCAYTGDEETARQTAESFLSKYYPEYFQNSKMTWSYFSGDTWHYSPMASFDYSRTVDGVLFNDNVMSVSVNVDTGTVDGFSLNWSKEDEVTFEPVENCITAEQALSSYLMHYETELSFVGVPTSYENYNYSYEGLLCYRLIPSESMKDAYIEGVDPHTGECLMIRYSPAEYAYEDVGASEYAEAINALATRGIGVPGGLFMPGEPLTVRDMLIFLLQAGAYRDAREYTDEDLLSISYSLHILSAKDMDMDATVTRAQMARTLIAMSGYGKAAALQGVYHCGFSDDDAIDPADYGYIAIAKGMGIAISNAQGAFRPNDAVTRAEAIAMLYAFMTRTV